MAAESTAVSGADSLLSDCGRLAKLIIANDHQFGDRCVT